VSHFIALRVAQLDWNLKRFSQDGVV
jgi:hypothetical protein